MIISKLRKIHQAKFAYILILALIILLTIFFRSYKAVERFDFAHDGDLYSWIVKDIVVDKHPRLIGQQTSTQGIYIGSLFYYSLIPFFILTSMDPKGVIGFAILLSIATVLSYYFIFGKLFGRQTGLIAAFLQAVFLSRIMEDRWVVPTVTSTIWEIWYFYTIVMLSKGNFTVFPLLGLLIGLIWHINFSLVPILVVVPFAILFSHKIPKLVDLLKGVIATLISSIPLIVFEYKHQFIQTKGLFASFLIDQGGGIGAGKLRHVLDQVSGNVVATFFYPYRNIFIPNVLFLVIFFMIGFFLVRKKAITKHIYVLLFIWVFSMISFFTLSSKIISEYYFNNINTVYFSLSIIVTSLIFKSSLKNKIIILSLFIILLSQSIIFILNGAYYNFLGYNERKKVTSFIANDSRSRGFPCVAVSYITTPGNNFGFRYLFYLEKLHVNQSLSGSPDYTIVIPGNLYDIKADKQFGAIGIIVPKEKSNQDQINYSCSGQDSNLTDPLFGFSSVN